MYRTFFAFLKCTIQGGPNVDVLLIAFLYLWLKFWEGVDKYWIVPVRKSFYFHHWLIVILKRSNRFCKCISEWATRAVSSAYSSSRISTRLVLAVARSRERLNSPPVLRVWSMTPSSSGKACARRAEKNIPNNVGAMTQPRLTPLQIGKVFDMEPSNWTLAFMFSWNATRMESSVSGQPNSFEYVMQAGPAHRIEGFSQVYEVHTQRA